MKKIKTLIFIILIVLFIIFCYQKFFLKNQNIQPFGVTILQVLSNSMSPEFNKGDIIVIKKQKDYEIGEIITYQTNEKDYVTHRVIEKYEDGFITKGDNNNVKDEGKIKIEQIKGKVILKINL